VRDHGGDLDAAIARHGGAPADWLDLSTGINPRPYPLPTLPARAWGALPTRAEIAALCDAARAAYGTDADIVPLAGAQAAIQIVPHLHPAGRARVLTPTYNEHAATLRAAGWQVEECATLDALRGADLAVVVNPNNPDGRRHPTEALTDLGQSVGLLVVDESFCDAEPTLSLAGRLSADADRIVVQRSFGKFYGLAGLRLGFVLTGGRLADRMRAMGGPWPVSGPAIAIGQTALGDDAWRTETAARLDRDAARLDALCVAAGWSLVGGTSLFRTYETGDAAAARTRLAEGRIWARIFPYSPTWIRLGLPGDEPGWSRLAERLDVR